MSKTDFIIKVYLHPLLVAFVPEVSVRLYIASQFALESNFGTSELANKYHNFCGMKVPHRRYSYRLNSDSSFAMYACFDDCIKDYLSWIAYNRPYQNQLDSIDSYRIFLRDSGYCPDKDYISRIDVIYNHLLTL